MSQTSPATEAALFDYLGKHFGLGHYDELASAEPWWKHRGGEIAKIKASRRARDVSIEQLWIAARYAQAHQITIRNFTWLYKLIPDATTWHRAQVQAQDAEMFEELYESAISFEFEQVDSTWLDRLNRAQGEVRKDVYTQWLETQ